MSVTKQGVIDIVLTLSNFKVFYHGIFWICAKLETNMVSLHLKIPSHSGARLSPHTVLATELDPLFSVSCFEWII